MPGGGGGEGRVTAMRGSDEGREESCLCGCVGRFKDTNEMPAELHVGKTRGGMRETEWQAGRGLS